MLLEKNKLLNLQRFSFKNMCENEEQLRSATGSNPDSFMRLLNYLNLGDDCSYIKLYGTSKRLSEKMYTNSEEVKSGPNLKISAKEQSHPATKCHDDFVTTSLCKPERRRRYTSNETSW